MQVVSLQFIVVIIIIIEPGGDSPEKHFEQVTICKGLCIDNITKCERRISAGETEAVLAVIIERTDLCYTSFAVRSPNIRVF